MAVRVKLDEDLSPLVAEPLVSAGHTVVTVSVGAHVVPTRVERFGRSFFPF